MVKIGIIGGSGLDNPNILEDGKDIEVNTPYGQPSSLLKVGKIKNITNLPFGACGNGAGETDNEDGWKFTDTDHIDNYILHCQKWIDLGANIIGGCCGTNQEYTKAYSRLRRNVGKGVK